jgi:IS30 family transposase
MGYKHLAVDERYQIHAMMKAGFSKAEIARELDRHPSTIGREMSRNTGLRGYRPKQAHRLAQERRSAHAHCRIHPITWERVDQLLREDWSPEQVSAWLDKSGLQSVSPEWIYQHILADKQRGGTLYKHLRCQKKRKKRYGSPDSRGQLKNRVSIDDRPPIVDRRERIGDWEIDTVIGRQGGSVLVTAVERKTRYSVIALSEDKSAQNVKCALVEALEPFSNALKTMTYDNGKEFALHEDIAKQLGANSYFAHPYHSWERGCNENTNGLIRQYVPKGSSFDGLTDEDVRVMMDKLNDRPRKCLKFKTPNQALLGINPKIALAS